MKNNKEINQQVRNTAVDKKGRPVVYLDERKSIYNSVDEALNSIPITNRNIGLTVPIYNGIRLIEYWWDKGIKNSDLVKKFDTNDIVVINSTLKYLEDKIDSIPNIRFELVESLPDVGEDNIIYMILSPTPTERNQYDEYIWLSSKQRYERWGSIDTEGNIIINNGFVFDENVFSSTPYLGLNKISLNDSRLLIRNDSIIYYKEPAHTTEVLKLNSTSLNLNNSNINIATNNINIDLNYIMFEKDYTTLYANVLDIKPNPTLGNNSTINLKVTSIDITSTSNNKIFKPHVNIFSSNVIEFYNEYSPNNKISINNLGPKIMLKVHNNDNTITVIPNSINIKNKDDVDDISKIELITEELGKSKLQLGDFTITNKRINNENYTLIAGNRIDSFTKELNINGFKKVNINEGVYNFSIDRNGFELGKFDSENYSDEQRIYTSDSMILIANKKTVRVDNPNENSYNIISRRTDIELNADRSDGSVNILMHTTNRKYNFNDDVPTSTTTTDKWLTFIDNGIELASEGDNGICGFIMENDDIKLSAKSKIELGINRPTEKVYGLIINNDELSLRNENYGYIQINNSDVTLMMNGNEIRMTSEGEISMTGAYDGSFTIDQDGWCIMRGNAVAKIGLKGKIGESIEKTYISIEEGVSTLPDIKIQQNENNYIKLAKNDGDLESNIYIKTNYFSINNNNYTTFAIESDNNILFRPGQIFAINVGRNYYRFTLDINNGITLGKSNKININNNDIKFTLGSKTITINENGISDGTNTKTWTQLLS